jgi:hypothetical protein
MCCRQAWLVEADFGVGECPDQSFSFRGTDVPFVLVIYGEERNLRG